MNQMVAVALAAATIGVLAPAPSALAAGEAAVVVTRRPPVPTVTVSGLPSPRLDQDTTQTVTAVGASREAAVTVSWGDGSMRSAARSSCSVTRAVKRPATCTLTLGHEYSEVGTFTIEIRSGKRVVGRTSVVVREAPRPWSPPAGWVQPSGWAYYAPGATYVPCSTVLWHFDATNQPAAAAGMHDEVVGALARLSAETGLTFTETTEPAAARLSFGWTDLSSRGSETAGVGGRFAGQGAVAFSTTHWWPTDQWPGYGVVVQPDGSYAIGRGWLVVHEVMHALGMDHVNDPTQIMNPIAGNVTDLGPGDRDGLRTMYLNNPCPV